MKKLLMSCLLLILFGCAGIDDIKAHLVAKAASLGFDTAKLIYVAQE
jgi:hypothetical protein